jgi:hypothetical protein
VALDNNAAYIRISALDASGYTEDGYDIQGYDRAGWNLNKAVEYNKNGYDRDGYDKNGYDKDGYNKSKLSNNKYKIGMTGSSGGYIFYDKGTFSGGWRFLEAAPASAEFEATWDDAMERCRTMSIKGLTGWRLPDKDELNLIYVNMQDYRSFRSKRYWSSSEYDSSSAWAQRFGDGSQANSYSKSSRLYVRAIRAF